MPKTREQLAAGGVIPSDYEFHPDIRFNPIQKHIHMLAELLRDELDHACEEFDYRDPDDDDAPAFKQPTLDLLVKLQQSIEAAVADNPSATSGNENSG